ncbi:MAG TPA: TetR/AcrR family transcriptional regulator [Isosphaeraceae bacterium]|jgi:AcrR family transcriptional regulator
MRTADPSKAPRILEAAALLFAGRPYHEVRMDDIAGQAGVAKGTLYLHFRDKEALYLALIDEGLRRQMLDVKSQLVDVSDPFDKVRYITRAAVLFFEKYPHFLELLPSLEAKLPQSPDVPLRMRREDFNTLLGGVLEEVAATGKLGVEDPLFAALCFVGILHEVLKMTPRPWSATIADRIAGHFLYGVRGGAG